LYLLAKQFGSPSQRGISIPFTLPHTRLAELIGCTRPIVTRQLISLRERGELHISETDNSMLLIPSDD
jgi:CRP-like cAMP-binding protein